MNELTELLTDGHYIELSKDGDRYVIKLFKKREELAVEFGRGESIAEAILIILEKRREQGRR